MAMKYFRERKYLRFSSSVESFYDKIESEMTMRGFEKVGVQMGLGLTFSEPRSSVWGCVKAKMRAGTLDVFISTENRRLAMLTAFLALVVSLPFLLPLLALMKFRIIGVTDFLGLTFGYVAVVMVLAYETAMGIFPSSRRFQKTLMTICDQVCEKEGALPKGTFETVVKYLKTKRQSNWEWRLWKWRPWPDMITREELIESQ